MDEIIAELVPRGMEQKMITAGVSMKKLLAKIQKLLVEGSG